MDVLSLDSESEANYFLNLLNKKASWFDQYTHVGGMTLKGGSRSEWYWVNSGARINYPIKWGKGEPDNDSGEYCLSIVKSGNNFYFNDIMCEKGSNLKFICQREVLSF